MRASGINKEDVLYRPLPQADDQSLRRLKGSYMPTNILNIELYMTGGKKTNSTM